MKTSQPELAGLAPPRGEAPPALPFAELVALVAAVFALNALAIDMMLPALGVIADELGAARDNDRQLIVGVYLISNGVAQLFFGPLVDRFGRRTVILLAMAGYLAGSLLSIVASSFALLLAARAFQGVATAASRVAIMAVVRDQVSGRRMAEAMSIAITIFMAAPILAPGLGQLILMAAPWRGIFIALLVYGGLITVWLALRLPETLAPALRTPLQPRRIAACYLEFISNRVALGYTLVAALAFGALFGYLSASEQIFVETFDLGALFPVAFGVVAAALAAANILNARIVGRVGMRRLCHGAVIGLVVANLLHVALVMAMGESLVMFLVFMSVSFFCIGLIGPNCSALAMEPMGHIAGSAAAVNGFAGTTLAGLLGSIIGRFYNGTTLPIVIGFAILGAVSLAVALWTEKGRLFEVKSAPIK